MERYIQIHKYRHADDARVNMMEQQNHSSIIIFACLRVIKVSHDNLSCGHHDHFSHRFMGIGILLVQNCQCKPNMSVVMMQYVNKLPYQKCSMWFQSQW